MTDHDRWDEQAAAYSLDALDDDERAEFETHLAGCERCRELVDAHSLVAAQLGSLAGDGVAAPPWSSIRDGVVGATPAQDAEVVVLRHRRRTALLAAAAAVVVVAAGLTAWQVTRGTTTQPLASIAACERASSCRAVALKGDNGSPATVLVDGDRYTLVSTSMPAPPTGHVWALWQVTQRGGPLLLTEFTSSVRPGQLKTSLADTAGFAVSEEQAGPPPASPHRIVADSSLTV